MFSGGRLTLYHRHCSGSLRIWYTRRSAAVFQLASALLLINCRWRLATLTQVRSSSKVRFGIWRWQLSTAGLLTSPETGSEAEASEKFSYALPQIQSCSPSSSVRIMSAT